MTATSRRGQPSSAKTGHWWELPIVIVCAVVVAVLVKTFVVQPFYIPSESMEHTLYGCYGCRGDKILVNKTVYDVRAPEPGDIVVFSRPDAWPPDSNTSAPAKTTAVTGPLRSFGRLVGVVASGREDLVKRVIAVGGQTVKCCDARGRVQVSATGPGGPFRSLDEPYVDFLLPLPETGSGKESAFGPVTVPHGRLWVLGDHRTDSADSRAHCGPGGTGAKCDPQSSTVPVSRVIGKAVVIAWPVSRWRTLGTPADFGGGSLLAVVLWAFFGAVLAVCVALIVRRRRFRRRSV